MHTINIPDNNPIDSFYDHLYQQIGRDKSLSQQYYSIYHSHITDKLLLLEY